MDPIPLFTLNELRQAFGLVVRQELADRLAQEWFAMFSDGLDSEGRFLCPPELFQSSNVGSGGVVTGPGPSWPASSDFVWLKGLSDEYAESLLLRLTDLELDLVSLVSPYLAQQVQLVRGPNRPIVKARIDAMRLALAPGFPTEE